jgi:hypothetical protein
VKYTINQRDGVTALDHYVIADLVVTRKRGKRLSALLALELGVRLISKLSDSLIDHRGIHAPALSPSSALAHGVHVGVGLIECQ